MQDLPHIKKIYGPPGTGKTTWLLNQLQVELGDGVPLKRIAFVTHTVAAKVEARERSEKVIKNINEEQFQYFKTIHGICYLELGLSRHNVMQTEDYLEFGKLMGIEFSTNFTDDMDYDGLPIGYNTSGGNKILAVRQYASAWRKKVSEVKQEWPNWVSHPMMREIILGYKKYKIDIAKFDFVDMLELYLNNNDIDPLDIDVLFIDEAQDLSKLQWAVVHKFMSKAQRIYIAGDDDQSIYGFIGADPVGFLNHPCDESQILPVTYRLLSKIWDYSQEIISKVPNRKLKQIRVRDIGGVISWFGLHTSYLRIDPKKSSMMIARHNKQLFSIARDLITKGIPFSIRGKPYINESKAKAVYQLYQLRHNKHISLKDAAYILKRANNMGGYRKLRAQYKENPTLLISGKQFLLEFGIDCNKPWINWLSSNTYDLNQNSFINDVIREVGLDAILEKPKIDLTTYHGSKGREADNIMLFTDFYKSAHNNAIIHPNNERRLCYVGVTRAKETVTIIYPETDLYMSTLIEGT